MTGICTCHDVNISVNEMSKMRLFQIIGEALKDPLFQLFLVSFFRWETKAGKLKGFGQIPELPSGPARFRIQGSWLPESLFILLL
jgi:hypothetical protein